VFIGSRIALLAEAGDKMTAADKAINYTSIVVGGLLGVGVGLLIYRRTMSRAAEIAAEEGEDIGVSRVGGATADPDGDEYSDDEFGDAATRRLMRASGAEADAAALMDDDDISLWEAEGVGLPVLNGNGNGHHWDEEAAVQGDGKQDIKLDWVAKE
jgi:hypothetical protein